MKCILSNRPEDGSGLTGWSKCLGIVSCTRSGQQQRRRDVRKQKHQALLRAKYCPRVARSIMHTKTHKTPSDLEL